MSSNYQAYQELLEQAKAPKKESKELYNLRKPMRDDHSESKVELPKVGDFNDPSTWGVL